MTYRGAWVAVEKMNSLAGVTSSQVMAGGHGGGGAELTEVGQQPVVELSRLSALQTQLFQSVAVFDEFD
jgi:molybdate transport system regulatory protein